LCPDLLVPGTVRIRILLSLSKNSKKNLDSASVFCDFLMTLFLKNDLNVASKSNKQKNVEK
jgi:hypothetical protein